MSNLVEHARRELELLGQTKEDPAFAESIVKSVEAFASYGNSGGSVGIAISMLSALLEYKNLSPLTDDPDEWYYHGPETWGDPSGDGVWQNKRNGEAFSHDGGKTYYLLSEGGNNTHRSPIHDSRYKKPCSICSATGPTDHSLRCPNRASQQRSQ